MNRFIKQSDSLLTQFHQILVTNFNFLDSLLKDN